MRKRWSRTRISRAGLARGFGVVVTPSTATVLTISALSLTGVNTPVGRERIASSERHRWATLRAARSAGHSRPYNDRGPCRP